MMPVQAWADCARDAGIAVAVLADVANTLVDWGASGESLDGQLSRASVQGVTWAWLDGLLVLGADKEGQCALWVPVAGVPEAMAQALAEWCKVQRVRVGSWDGIKGSWGGCVSFRAACVRAGKSGRDSYAVEITIVTAERGESLRAALNAAQSAKVSWDDVAGVAWSAAGSVALDAALDRSGADIRRHVVLVLGATEKATWSQGSTIPVARRVVSDTGTVSTVGHDSVTTGVEVTLSVVPDLGGLRVAGSVSTGTPTGYVDGIPTVSKSAVTCDVLTRPGVWSVWGGADSTRDESGTVGAWPLGVWRRRGAESWVVIGRVLVLRAETIENKEP
jgi:hypothetical protein